MRAPRVPGLLATAAACLLLLLPPVGPAAAQTPDLEIRTPSAWATGGEHTAAPKRSVAVSGAASHPSGIRRILADQRSVAIQRDDADSTTVRFSALVPAPALGETDMVEIRVEAMNGSLTTRRFPLTARRAPAEDVTFAPPGTEGVRRRFAVVIGISDYASEAIPDLAYAAEDARAFHEFLRSPAAGMGGFREENVRLLIDEEATARNARSALTTFFRDREVTREDVVILFMVAHGVPDPYRPDDVYVLTHDSRLDDIPSTALSLETVRDAIMDTRGYMKVVFADVARSAGVGGPRSQLEPNQANGQLLAEPGPSVGGLVIFTASEANQLSQEGEQWGGGHGVFTYFLLRGLRGEADEDQDRVVTLGEVMEYTRHRVRRETGNAQIPTISLTTYDRFWPMAAVIRR